jgi:hypothetical protein
MVQQLKDTLQTVFSLVTLASCAVVFVILGVQYFRKWQYESFLKKREELSGRNLQDTAPKYPLVFPIYLNFLKLHVLQSASWVVIVMYADLVDDVSFWEWGQYPKVRKSIMYVYGSGIVLALNAALNEGVLYFLAQDDIGAKALTRTQYFALGWGLFNFAIIATIGGVCASLEDGDEKKVYDSSPVWSPFFIRSTIMFLFHFVNVLIPDHWIRGRPPRRGPSRNAWFGLGLNNVVLSSLMACMYILSISTLGNESDVWVILLWFTFSIFILGGTPVTYLTLLRDSVQTYHHLSNFISPSLLLHRNTGRTSGFDSFGNSPGKV